VLNAERREKAEGYLAAAQEHHAALIDLPKTPAYYPLAYYLAGLAVECLFRAYTELVGGRHEAHHDLQRHADNARFLEFMPETMQDEVQADIGSIRTRWLNNHRYRALPSLRGFLNTAVSFS